MLTPMAVAWFLLGRLYDMLCISGYVDDVKLSHNAGHRSASETTRVFCPVRKDVSLFLDTLLCSRHNYRK